MLFRLHTWNCFGQGQGISAVTARRAPLGARLRDETVRAACSDADVVCVQELFSRDAQVFFDGLARHGLANVFRDDNRACFKSLTFRGTGLGIGSRKAPVMTRIQNFSGVSAGWDKLARKGALHARFGLTEDLHVDVVTSHLQAGSDPVARAVRLRQLDEVGELVRHVGDEHPFIVCGDFNICGLADVRETEDYRLLATVLPGFVDLGAEADLPTLDSRVEANAIARRYEVGDVFNRVDYVFFRPAGGFGRDQKKSARFEPSSIARILDRPLAAMPELFASDHYGLAASFSY